VEFAQGWLFAKAMDIRPLVQEWNAAKVQPVNRKVAAVDAVSSGAAFWLDKVGRARTGAWGNNLSTLQHA